MTIQKQCSRCGKKITVGSVCQCTQKRYKEDDKNKIDTQERKFYSSTGWKKIRKRAIDRFNGLDIYSLYTRNIIETGQTVHHIQGINKHWDKRLDVDNLIYLTESNHRKIHELTEADEKGTVRLLKGIIKKHLTK